LPNPSLRAERTTGWETGLAGDVPARYAACWRVGWFWNEVNRPITALTLSTTPTATTLMRENLGQLRSRGVSADLSVHLQSWLAVTGGYQFAKATVTRFAPEPALVGKWIPQVPRNTGTVQVTANRARWGLLSVQARGSGRQFDDDANTYVLHGFWRFDVYASHSFGQRWEVFTAVENLLDRSIDIGRTPIRTLGTPQLVRVGLRVRVPL
jgi:outer membrane receptor protein involved in Fe transport